MSPRASVQPLAVVSLSSSMLAYASAFVGSPVLIWPGIGTALVGFVTGVLARRAIAAAPGTFTGKAIATAGAVSGAAFVLLGAGLVMIARSSA